jgi:hypothetical protein
LIFAPDIKDNFRFLDKLDGWPNELKQTAQFFWERGQREVTTDVALECLERALTLAEQSENQFIKRNATIERIRRHYAAGRSSDGDRLLRAALGCSDRFLRGDAAEELLKQTVSGNIDGGVHRLLACCIGLASAPSEKLLQAAADAACSWKWPTLAIYFSTRFDRLAKNGTSKNQMGIACSVAGLVSTAHRSYESAASLGVSVAKVNIATLYEAGPVPNAGLQLLRAHDSEWDAADPGYPFETRARLERLINDENEQVQALYRRGEQLFKQFTDLSLRALASPIQHELPTTLILDGKTFGIKDPDPAMAHYATKPEDGIAAEHEFVFGVPYFSNVRTLRKQSSGVFIVRPDQSGLEGLCVDLESSEATASPRVIFAS